jgi:protoporphyrinogen oxidase
MAVERFDQVVLGAGLAGLLAALRQRRTAPDARLLVVDAAPRAGGAVQTLRSNGFVCELGPFAFAREEVAPLLAALQRPPTPIEPLPAGRSGSRFTGAALAPVAVAPLPVAFASGNEALVQACRRELGPTLRLGRAVTAIRAGDGGVELELGGETPTRCAADRLTLALPTAAAARLLAPYDRDLLPTAARLGGTPRAFVFLGGHGGDAPELRGYGIVPDDGIDTEVAEAIFCTQAFAGRALPGRCLVRLELAAAPAGVSDAALAATAVQELRRWTGTTADFPFTKVHRFAADADTAAAAAECRARLHAAAARLGGVTIA